MLQSNIAKIIFNECTYAWLTTFTKRHLVFCRDLVDLNTAAERTINGIDYTVAQSCVTLVVSKHRFSHIPMQNDLRNPLLNSAFKFDLFFNELPKL